MQSLNFPEQIVSVEALPSWTKLLGPSDLQRYGPTKGSYLVVQWAGISKLIRLLKLLLKSHFLATLQF